jgi:DMSO/TMAO reductase YedYZ heme-binding membrane subunit
MVLAFRLIEICQRHIRHISMMNSTKNQQIYWSLNHSKWWPWVKKHILYAPIWKKRHNREFRLSSAINIGTLPSRFHLVILSLYFVSNIIYTVNLDYTLANKYELVASLRGRAGTLAVANMVPLILLAGRNNPLISILKVSFDTYNLLHRWMGRMVVLEAIVHVTAWTCNEVAAADWAGVNHKISTDPFISWGLVTVICMVLILFTSPSAIRHAFYETFLNIHVLLAFFAVVGVWIHCNLGQLMQFTWVKIIVALWVCDRFARLAKILWYNYARGSWTYATVESLSSEACRVTLHLPRHTFVLPGSHAYLRFSHVYPWESHPFSIAWTTDRPTTPSLPITEKADDTTSVSNTRQKSPMTTDISFVIQAQTGMTRKLYNLATASRRPIRMRAAFEGPYGGHNSLSSYGHVVLFAGSSGITHQIPFISTLISGYSASTVATRRILLVWIVRDLDCLEWVRPWMDTILQMPQRRNILTIKLFVTRPKSSREAISPSATVQMYPGRPNVGLLLQNEVREQVGAMAVTVCGPGGLADNVREAVRNVQYDGVVDFVEESFTW